MRYQTMMWVGILMLGMMIIPFQVMAQQSIEYTIKKGDTLWDISKQYRGTPYDWPDLWYLNKDVPILNPHEIFPGQRIRITPKSAASYPSPVMSPVPFSTKDTPSFSEPQSDKQQPFTSSIQPVSPDGRGFGQFKKEDEQTSYFYSRINQAGFIRKESIPPYGVIFKVKDNKQMISKGDIVYIKETDSVDKSLIIGKQYTIYRTFPPLIDKETNQPIGIQHLLLGVLEITEKESNLSVGKIINSYRNIQIGDMIIPFSQRSPNIQFIAPPKDLTGKVLVSEDHARLIGSDMVVFINKGASDGVKPGQRFLIYEQETAKPDSKFKEAIKLPPTDYAVLLVLLTEENTSTVLVTNAVKNLSPGATFRPYLK